MTSIALWTILVGALASVNCSLVGSFLVLRKMSLLGDAISHAVLPGIAIGFMLSGKITGPAIVLGAMGMGVLTAILTQWLSQYARVSEDAGMGVVFTSLFALGVILINVAAKNVDLDAGCVLYGQIEFTSSKTLTLAGLDIPEAVISLGLILILIVAMLAVLWKELKLSAFDSELADTLGFSSYLMHLLLMSMTSAVTVAAFESVGSILVVAMLIVPAATASLLTTRLFNMMIMAAGTGITSSILGYMLADAWNTSVAGMMAVCAGLLFTGAVFLSPSQGVIVRLLRQIRLSLRVMREDVLSALYRAREKSQSGLQQAALLHNKGSWLRQYTMNVMKRRKLIDEVDGRIHLTQLGLQKAERIIRTHRIWESYLQRNVALPADHLHSPAESIEHYVGPELLESLSADLNRPAADPHGKAIPGQTLSNEPPLQQ
ncbi:MAG: metal ABC transporter permease [Planctomycetia bacterium]|nr:metal ABC transporter permease [Planctomycetia bacterium]